jgi:hypothetical protein
VYGPPTTIYNRYNRWSQLRVWQRIFEKMAAAGPIWPSRERMVAFPLNRLLSGPRNALDGLRGRPACNNCPPQKTINGEGDKSPRPAACAHLCALAQLSIMAGAVSRCEGAPG